MPPRGPAVCDCRSRGVRSRTVATPRGDVSTGLFIQEGRMPQRQLLPELACVGDNADADPSRDRPSCQRDVDRSRTTHASRTVIIALVASVLCLAFPSTTIAQSAIAGVVRDTTGAVLPGVTVEAS